jgi:thioredoxin-like negative regulator of GroEL
MIYPGSDVVPAATIAVVRAILPADTMRSVNLLQRLQSLYPKTAEAGEGAALEAEILLAAGSIDSARGLLRESAERLDSFEIGGRLWLYLADTYRESSQSDSATALLEHVALRSDSIGASAVMRLVERSEAAGDLTNATSRLEVLIERFSRLPEIRSAAQLHLAELYGRMGDVEKSRALYQTIAKERPDDHFGIEARDRLQSLIHQ